MARKKKLTLWNEGGYEENLMLIQSAASELLDHMKGYDCSFRREITDEKGVFSQEKLQDLVEEMLSHWEMYQRDSRPEVPGFQERRELYRNYLYLVMRCCLEKNGYNDARRCTDMNERADFAFLMKQARQFIRDWYAVPAPDGSLRNEVFGGYDAHFGFHVYYPLNDPNVFNGTVDPGNDFSLTPDWKIRWSWEDLAPKPRQEETTETEGAVQPDDACVPCAEDDACVSCPEDEEDYDPFCGDDLEEDNGLDSLDLETYNNYMAWLSEQDDRAQRMMLLAMRFKCPEEYQTACNRFVELFTKAPPEVPRDFCADLEKIVDLYLIKRGIPPLMNKDKTLDVYNCLCDGSLRQAARYGRGVQWKAL